MSGFSRRSFLKTSAAAAAGALVLPALGNGWFSLAGAQDAAYFSKEFGVTDAMCTKVLAAALSKGGDYADLYFEHTLANYIILEDGKVNRAFRDVALGVGIRAVKGDQVGYAFTQEMTESSMLRAAATAAAIADGAPGRGPAKIEPAKLPDFYPMKSLLTSVPVQPKVDLVQSLNDRCFALCPQLVKVSAIFHDQQKRIRVVTSDGLMADDLQPRTFLNVSVVGEKNGRREQAGYSRGGRRDWSFYTPQVVEAIAQTAVKKVNTLFEAVQPPAGEMPVVLGPGVAAVLLHEAIGHGMEADFNRKKTSIYSTMIGKKVAEPFVQIVDDGTMPYQLGSINIDDEGTPSQRTFLVENGILTSYMHDRISARFYGLKSTGNGRRQSYQHFVQPRMRNTCMLAGSAKPEDVVKSVKKGIYVEDVANGEVHIGEGSFAFYVSMGHAIEDGKLGAPIKDVNIMGNGPQMLADITMVADDFMLSEYGTGSCGKAGQSVPAGFGQPTCLVKSLTVGGVKA